MIQAGKNLGLAGKTTQEAARFPRLWTKDFDGDLAAQVDILGLVDCRHATSSEGPKDAVVSDYLIDQIGELLHICLFLPLTAASLL